MHDIFQQAILEALNKAQDLLAEMQDAEEQLNEGAAFGDLENDSEIRADKALGEMFQDFFLKFAKENQLLGRITVEGLEDIHCGDGDYWITIDPLDGSLNFKSRGHTMGLPFSICISLLQKKDNAKFSDVVMAAVLDLRGPKDLWFVQADDDGEMSVTINSHPAKTMDEAKLDLGKQILFGEMYYPDNREMLTKAFLDLRGWLRNPGSAAYEMAMVASGGAVAFVCNKQKQHELGAAVAMVVAAGGVAIDFDGNDLRDKEFLFNVQTPVILAANQAIADEILHRLRSIA